MYCKLICILYALLCGQNFILIKSGCYINQQCRNDHLKVTNTTEKEMGSIGHSVSKIWPKPLTNVGQKNTVGHCSGFSDNVW
jgi:hypothetical protein